MVFWWARNFYKAKTFLKKATLRLHISWAKAALYFFSPLLYYVLPDLFILNPTTSIIAYQSSLALVAK